MILYNEVASVLCYVFFHVSWKNAILLVLSCKLQQSNFITNFINCNSLIYNSHVM